MTVVLRLSVLRAGRLPAIALFRRPFFTMARYKALSYPIGAVCSTLVYQAFHAARPLSDASPSIALT
jgi:hypothetical protein